MFTIKTELLQTKKEIVSSEEIDIIDYNYGVLKIISDKTNITNKNIHIILSLDRSGSMQGSIDELKHCAKNIVNYLFNKQNGNIYISILFFDHSIETICMQEKLIDMDKKEDILCKMLDIDIRGTTNIGKVFDTVADLEMNDVDNYHIFMTDGNPTTGVTKESKLVEKMQNNINHIVIGFNSDHNGYLMNNMAKTSNELYYYIDNIENAGMVYGEIIDKILYKSFTHVNVFDLNETVEFYNMRTSEWVHSLAMDYICSDETKFVYYRFNWDTTDTIELCVYGTPTNTETPAYGDETYIIPVLKKINILYDTYTETSESTRNVEIMKHYIRCKSLETIYKIIEYYESTRDEYINSEYKTTLMELFEKTTRFSREHQLDDDELMSQIIDNIYVQTRMFYDVNRNVSLARYINDIEQRSFNIVLQSQYTNTNMVRDIPTQQLVFLPLSNTDIDVNQLSHIEQYSCEDPQNSYSQYTPLQRNITASQYTTPQRLDVMRELSQQN